MKTLLWRATAVLNRDPALKALWTSFVCGCSAFLWTLTTVAYNDAVQHSMLRGRAYTDATFWGDAMLGIDIALLVATVLFFAQAIRIVSRVEQ